MEVKWDCFFSYPRSRLDEVKPLLTALAVQHLLIWQDEMDVPHHSSITHGIAEGLSNSRTLLVYYAKEYGEQDACRRELQAALLAGEDFVTSIQRIMVINPEETSGHIHPIELRDARFLSALHHKQNVLAWQEIAQKITEHVHKFESPIGAQIVQKRPRWHGAPVQGTSRFVGRWEEVWALHSRLLAEDFSMTSGGHTTPLGCVFIRGIGGVGKTQLAIQYARQCAGSWPGGVY